MTTADATGMSAATAPSRRAAPVRLVRGAHRAPRGNRATLARLSRYSR
jgi:hypothetical protein